MGHVHEGYLAQSYNPEVTVEHDDGTVQYRTALRSRSLAVSLPLVVIVESGNRAPPAPSLRLPLPRFEGASNLSSCGPASHGTVNIPVSITPRKPLRLRGVRTAMGLLAVWRTVRTVRRACADGSSAIRLDRSSL